ncbi:class I poly(R)-hydroxyalkanoic acid synthase [Aliidongia dinghuensis]|uniref:Class I poly(R)-hydroxyalkanoic acid synthase n=1 Tax=Aliidongia dinghuensis TaxID=1867774 RepID=A0A8J3E667_9PROT|nr:class I poly(R)-hydroxyalkanoic acid synthase [Aliidongia dinghuensis]GGF38650.1 class I poly(R)-hydroxyalkanoic acid synthase [Aliidongia dinghuensis]
MAAAVDLLSEANPLHQLLPIDWGEITRALSTLAARALAHPVPATTAVAKLGLQLWWDAYETSALAALRWQGVSAMSKSQTADRRFDAPEWVQHPFFRWLQLSYHALSGQLLEAAEQQARDSVERQRLVFHLRQLIDATSPTLFLPTNPAALRKAFETGGSSLADGWHNLLADLSAGRLSMTDADAFTLGRDLAVTPGKVVFRNRLIELIQYAPQTAETHEVPLLIVPPWINKFYILDLQPKNSLVRFLLAQGFTVFMISWKNPDASMEGITFEDYMTEGPLAASEVAREITGAEQVNPIGYCIGGTLLAVTLAYLAAERDRRFGPATFMVSLLDFSEVGDTAVFIDEPQIEYMEERMLERGYLDSRAMSNMFNLLRSNDLIWSTVTNNYLMGNKPPAFDLLFWNSDGTRMARAAHSFYLRNTYLENNLIRPGGVSLLGQPIDLRRIRQHVYAVGAEKDHIVPWRSAWQVTRLTGARTRFVLAASGHIAGMINPPSQGKGGHWTNEAPSPPKTVDAWLAGAGRHDGSWWPDWAAWLAARSGRMAPAPSVGSAAHRAICDAPGTYVLER